VRCRLRQRKAWQARCRPASPQARPQDEAQSPGRAQNAHAAARVAQPQVAVAGDQAALHRRAAHAAEDAAATVVLLNREAELQISRHIDRDVEVEPKRAGIPHRSAKCGIAVFNELKQGIDEIGFLADPTVGELRIGCPENVATGLVRGRCRSGAAKSSAHHRFTLKQNFSRANCVNAVSILSSIESRERWPKISTRKSSTRIPL
jgi:hypothetical protein